LRLAGSHIVAVALVRVNRPAETRCSREGGRGEETTPHSVQTQPLSAAECQRTAQYRRGARRAVGDNR